MLIFSRVDNKSVWCKPVCECDIHKSISRLCLFATVTFCREGLELLPDDRWSCSWWLPRRVCWLRSALFWGHGWAKCLTKGKGKAKAYNTCRAPQAATATSEALVMSQAKLAYGIGHRLSLHSQADQWPTDRTQFSLPFICLPVYMLKNPGTMWCNLSFWVE